MKSAKSKKRRKKTISQKIKEALTKVGTLNIVLLCVFAYTIYINWKMINVFLISGSAPETAWCALIAALLGECGICGWIKTSKEKHSKQSEIHLDPNEAEEYVE